MGSTDTNKAGAVNKLAKDGEISEVEGHAVGPVRPAIAGLRVSA